MLSTAPSISVKSTIESMLTWVNVKNASTKPPPGDRTLTSNRYKDIFSVMVTPDRIPKFFIPSLEVHGQGDQEQEAEEGLLLPPCEIPSSGTEPRVKRDRLLKRAVLCKKSSVCGADGGLFCGDPERAAEHSDPATRAAMSLPHLQKITTPYGFLALGEIPHIRRKESLFFEHDVADIRAVPDIRKPSPALGRSRSSPLSDLKQHSPTGSSHPHPPVGRANRSVSWETITSPSRNNSRKCWKNSTVQATSPSRPTYPVSAPRSYTSRMKDKSKLQLLIKKHLTNIKRMRFNSSSERLADRTLGSPSA